MQLKWLHSYETIKYDTLDGDLHKGQYALYKGDYRIRTTPENNSQPTIFKTKDDRGNPVIVDLTGLTEVKVLEGEHIYYNVYELPSGRLYRERTDENSYKGLSIKNSKRAVRDLTQGEINQITKDDGKW